MMGNRYARACAHTPPWPRWNAVAVAYDGRKQPSVSTSTEARGLVDEATVAGLPTTHPEISTRPMVATAGIS